jgi:hypothetical protein
MKRFPIRQFLTNGAALLQPRADGASWTVIIDRQPTTTRQTKKPGLATGLLDLVQQQGSCLCLILHRGIVAFAFGIDIAVDFSFGLRLGPAPRLFAGCPSISLTASVSVTCGTTAISRHSRSRAAIELTFAVRLLGLRFRAIQVAHHFGDGDDDAGIDLGFVLLGAARPHGALGRGPSASPAPS